MKVGDRVRTKSSAIVHIVGCRGAVYRVACGMFLEGSDVRLPTSTPVTCKRCLAAMEREQLAIADDNAAETGEDSQ